MIQHANPFEGMLIKLEFITDDKGFVRKAYRVYNNGVLVDLDGRSEFLNDNEAERAFLKALGRRRL